MSDDNQKQNLSAEERRIKAFLQQPVNIEKNAFDPEVRQVFDATESTKVYRRISWWERFTNSHYFRKNLRQFKRFSRESLPMILFVGFSTVVVWKMESQYDEMKQKFQNIKTLKEIEIEEEDKYIKSMLTRKRLNLDVPIVEKKNLQKYKFEDEDDEDEGAYTISTKDDFLDAIHKDKINLGLPIPNQFQTEYDEYLKQTGGKTQNSTQSKFEK